MISAVIFDMDGLIMDSERIGISVIHEEGKKQGFNIPHALIKKTLGATPASSSEIYHRHFPHLETQVLFHNFHDSMRELAAEGKIPLKKGVKELLAALDEKNIPRAVASSSPLPIIELYLSKAGILSSFQHLQSGGNGILSKPAPDIFLVSARALGADPAACLVLEDSANGVKAGRAAGMQVCMVPDQIPFHPDLAPYCDHVLDDLTAVIPLLQA